MNMKASSTKPSAATMRSLIAVAFLVTMALGDAGHQAVSVTPIQKVIEMLNGMIAKGKSEKNKEEVAFAKFHEWCDNLKAEKTKSIDDGSMQIKTLEADIDKAASDAEVLKGEITDLQGERAAMNTEASKAKAVRKAEVADYSAQHLDYDESISAIERAIATLKAKKTDVAQSLVQVQGTKMIPDHARNVIQSFLSLRLDEDAGEPEANAYEFQSGGVVDMLEKLQLKFQDELLAIEKDEMGKKHNFEVLLQQLTDDIEANKESSSKKTSLKAGRQEDAAGAKGDKLVTEASKAEDEKTLSETNVECKTKSEEFETNQGVRSDELEALGKAVDIISSGAVAGNADKHLPSAALLQAKKSTAFAQLRSTVQPDTRSQAAAYLQKRAQQLGSRYLSVMAAHVTEDPFGKIKKMIKDMIVKLSEEANAEADHNSYCQSELATNKQTRDNKGAEVEELTANADQKAAESETLAAEITNLSDALAEISGQQSSATKIRSEDKASNTQTVADATEAQVAVQNAMRVLKEFYDNVGEASMMQEPYKGMGSSNGGVVGMLEVILSDFNRLETDTSATEDQDAAAYQRFMAESDEVKAVKGTEMKHKEKKRRQTDEALRGLRKQIGFTQDELDKSLDYYDKLKADCLDNGLSYEDRVKGREEEIKSLQEALRILDGEDLA